MELNLNPIEIRVLGCLVEKELATPEYYPLSLNSLTTACNQKSNRQPVMELAETEVVRALDTLRSRGLAMQSAEGGRVPKYQHALAAKLHLDPPELAIVAELLLRGPQTVGELRTRCERMCSFGDLETVEAVLQELADHTPPLVARLPRQPGRKENRFAQLLAGEPDLGTEELSGAIEPARRQVAAEDERLAHLETEIAELRTEVAELRQLLESFQAQFE
ncbi:MAG: YceH family protein [Desulfuromonadales bacterium]|nr:YceH family protein [Desulfuromonadales bacterium]